MNSDKTVYAVWAADANNNGIPDYLETQPTATPRPSNGPKTGDDSQIGLWIAVMLVSVLGLTGCVILGRKKKTSKDGR